MQDFEWGSQGFQLWPWQLRLFESVTFFETPQNESHMEDLYISGLIALLSIM